MIKSREEEINKKILKAKNKVIGCFIALVTLGAFAVVAVVFGFIFPKEFSAFAAGILVFCAFLFAPVFIEMLYVNRKLKSLKKRLNPQRTISDMV